MAEIHRSGLDEVARHFQELEDPRSTVNRRNRSAGPYRGAGAPCEHSSCRTRLTIGVGDLRHAWAQTRSARAGRTWCTTASARSAGHEPPGPAGVSLLRPRFPSLLPGRHGTATAHPLALGSTFRRRSRDHAPRTAARPRTRWPSGPRSDGAPAIMPREPLATARNSALGFPFRRRTLDHASRTAARTHRRGRAPSRNRTDLPPAPSHVEGPPRFTGPVRSPQKSAAAPHGLRLSP